MAYTYKYPRAALTVDIILIAGPIVNPMLLLIQRKNEPYKGKWAFPGGFLDMNETLKQAAERELEEETGVKGIELKQFHVFDAIDRDPRERTISTVHFGFSDDLLPVKGGDDAQDAEWFQINNLPELAFDHREIIHKFIEKHLKQ
jgi:8-oxo-dGTP diphosphatase